MTANRSPGRHRHPLLVITTVVALLITGAAPALARPLHESDDSQHLIDGWLAAHPGGRQINATEISYSDGGFIVAVSPARHMGGDSARVGVPDCPSGWFCFYDGLNYGYPRGRLSSCGWQDLAWWGWHNRTEAVHYNLATGSVLFINHGGADHLGDVAVFDAGTHLRARADVYPYRNQTDHVYRTC